MIQTIPILPGVTLRCFRDDRFKQSGLSLQFVRPMQKEEAAMNALLPAVLLRGSRSAPDLRAITLRLDDLYGAGVGAQVRRVGDYQTTGLSCSFMKDRYAMEDDRVFVPMMDFLQELMLEPLLEEGTFKKDFVDSEKRNLISSIAAQRNDKRAYANARMIEAMCRNDSFGVPRLGEIEDVEAITAQKLYAHYQRVLRESPVHVFYMGEREPEELEAQVRRMFASIDRAPVELPPQTGYHVSDPSDKKEVMDVAQGKLSMGFYTPITLRDAAFVPMQIFNTLFGAGMTCKLFMTIREQMSLCYDIGSTYHGSKGIVMVSAGIDCDKDTLVRQQVLKQLQACQQGDFTDEELRSAKEALLSQLRSTHDSPGAIEGYYATAALSGMKLSPEDYMEQVEAATARQVMDAAKTLQLHTVYFVRGEG